MKTYRGWSDGHTVEVDGRLLDPRLDLRHHSPTGFSWGSGSSGPAQLALALLADLCTDKMALAYYQDFKFRVVANLNGDEPWAFTDAELRALFDGVGAAAGVVLPAPAPGPFVPPAIAADELVWTESGEQDPNSRLLATINLAGCLMHLEAYAVAEMKGHDPVQHFDGDSPDTPAKVYAAVGGDGPWHTVMIDDREYVLIATPFCD